MSHESSPPSSSQGPAHAEVHTEAIGRLGEVAPRRGAEVLLEILESEGVEYIFGNPGTTELPLIDALLTRPEISYIWGLQEASVVAMGDGYAQATRRPAFVNLHTAGGLGHGLGGIINANVSNTPLVVTAGQQDSRHTVTDPLLFGDLVSIAKPVAKWSQEVTTASQLPVLVRRAFHDSSAAPTGPVFLSLPMDIMQEMTTVGIARPSTIDRRSAAGSLDILADYLAAVPPGRVAVIAGDEIDTSDAAPETVRLAEVLGAPVFGSSWPAHIPFPTSHPLWRGNLPTKAIEINRTLSDFDCVFALGGKSVITILYTEGSPIPDGCEVYQLSTDVRDLGRTYSTRLSVLGDIKTSLKILIPMLEAKLAGEAEARRALVDAAGRARAVRRGEIEAEARRQMDRPIATPLVAAHEVVRAVGPRTRIVDEAIATSVHVRSLLDSTLTRQYSFLRGGGLGWGMPASVGFCLGFGREPIVCLVGDGAAMYSPQALWTAAREKLPVTFVVMNNREYNILKNFMKAQTDYLSAKSNRFIAMDLVDPAIDFLALARSMGVPARRAESVADIGALVEAGIKSGLPNLIEVPISVE
ncbi:thiamine pyrophosphate-binding protein [Segnochrobactrum spirostomi]|uniref:Thiamine pyrophosphate-binding protein n=1 Tax=Segnochrobactrum spirostomi TaxID=2608987 RepID=A0A6A7XYF6_9HYPH|nr:thiamine pyrophosphate-binding protein [Segnochrobactrum spirostomi]MQT11316.1 thiamine pyrophosphate-binding protein [Segnochrobactrum spirostomi]